MNSLEHSSHLYGFSPVCIFMCLNKWSFFLKVFSHTWQGCCTLELEWVCMWLSRLSCEINEFQQILHGNCKLCIFLCLLSFCVPPNALSQTSHLCGFIFKWTNFLCVFKSLRRENTFEQNSHINLFSLMCLFVWSYKFFSLVNPIEQYSQIKGLSPVFTFRCTDSGYFWKSFRCSCSSLSLENDFGHTSHLKVFVSIEVSYCCFIILPPIVTLIHQLPVFIYLYFFLLKCYTQAM